MGTLVSSLFAFDAHAEVLSFRVWESVVQYRHDISQEPHTPLDLLLAYSPQDSLMSSCECIIMSFACLIEIYVRSPKIAFQPYSPSLSHVQPCRAILYILCSLIPYFLPRGNFPPECHYPTHVSLHSAQVCSTTWNQFVFPYDTRLLLVCNYKASFFFFQAFQITEKVQKNQKTKKPDKERCYLWQLSSRVAFEQSTVYHIHSLGYSLTLGAVLIDLSLSPPTG